MISLTSKKVRMLLAVRVEAVKQIAPAIPFGRRKARQGSREGNL